ncbi:MAG: TlyA family RNA methyltransferase [Pseudomonadota bacterium]
MRLDQVLVERGLAPTRSRAQAMIREGHICLDGRIVRKASIKADTDAQIVVSDAAHDYVSRAALKLAAALEAFSVDPEGCVCLDLGSSTGGFTDVLLRAGAERVYAVDVGHDQLAERLRGDPRVISLEGTHAKDVDRTLVPDPLDLIVCDVSFISVTKALPPVLALAREDARLITLLKPQFELGREAIGKNGRVRPSLEEQKDFLETHVVSAIADLGWRPRPMIESPILGGEGTTEFLLYANKTPA